MHLFMKVVQFLSIIDLQRSIATETKKREPTRRADSPTPPPSGAEDAGVVKMDAETTTPTTTRPGGGGVVAAAAAAAQAIVRPWDSFHPHLNFPLLPSGVGVGFLHANKLSSLRLDLYRVFHYRVCLWIRVVCHALNRFRRVPTRFYRVLPSFFSDKL